MRKQCFLSGRNLICKYCLRRTQITANVLTFSIPNPKPSVSLIRLSGRITIQISVRTSEMFQPFETHTQYFAMGRSTVILNSLCVWFIMLRAYACEAVKRLKEEQRSEEGLKFDLWACRRRQHYRNVAEDALQDFQIPRTDGVWGQGVGVKIWTSQRSRETYVMTRFIRSSTKKW